MSRKRSHREMEAVDDGKPTPEPSLLDKIRNMWQFASFMQYIFLFGKAAKIEDIDVEVLHNLEYTFQRPVSSQTRV